MRVLVAGALAVVALVRGRDQEQPAGREQAREPGQQRFLLLEVLQRLQAHDQVEARARQVLETGHVRASRIAGSRRVARLRVRHRLGCQVERQHAAGALGQERGAVPFPRGRVSTRRPCAQRAAIA
jgi:hypothetical protein